MKVPLLLRPALLPPSLVAYVLAQTTFAQNCSREPIYMDVHVRRVQGSTAFQWGAFVGAGTPAQNQSSWPSLRQNQTSVASIAYCEHSALEDCQNATHGNYDPSASSS
ncbi:MAG: hypothetical protein INR71_01760 [Terriglobus roseus]|nr:hypothetical protein [Terriglobus roseus]